MSIASLYPSINPSLLLDFANSKVLDPRITFSRTTTATYYDGVTTAKAEENLFTYSQEFDNAAWSKALVTITSNATTAPDGTSTADLAVANTTNGDHSVVQSFTFPADTTLTISCYMKAAGYDYGVIRHYSAGNGDVWASFNLSTGAVDSNSSGVTASITSVGSSWYRCVMTKTYSSATSGNSYGIRVANAGGIGTPFAGNGTSGIYIWGAQLEQRSSATAYTATTSQAITNYIPVLQTAAAGQARFDHNPTTGESLGLLIEEARTNVATYSEDFGNAAWSKGGSVVAAPVVTTNQVIAPNGTLTGDQVDLPAVSGTNAFSLIYFPFTASALAYTGSFYLKGKNGGEQIWINFTKNGVNYTQTLCTLTTSWQRFSLSSTLTAGGDNFQIGVDLRDSAQSAKSAQTFFIWGAQLEAGSFATSYIPTVASSVTRNADAASMTGTNFSSWFNNGEGTVYWDRRRTNTSANPEITIYNSTLATAFYNGSIAYINTAPSGTIAASSLANGVTQASITTGTGLTGTGSVKTAYAYKANDFAGSSNGQSAGTDTSGILQTGVDTLAFFTSGLNGFQHLGKFAYYPTRLTNAQLQALTV